MTTKYEVPELKPFSAGAKRVFEAGRELIYLPGLKVRGKTVDGLLCPSELNGYMTRLLLSEPMPERGQNWNPFSFLGRTWYTPSWQGVAASLPLPQMLLAHLAMYK